MTKHTPSYPRRTGLLPDRSRVAWGRRAGLLPEPDRVADGGPDLVRRRSHPVLPAVHRRDHLLRCLAGLDAGSWMKALVLGAAFGFFDTDVRHLTNLATLRAGPSRSSSSNIAWGTVLAASVATANASIGARIFGLRARRRRWTLRTPRSPLSRPRPPRYPPRAHRGEVPERFIGAVLKTAGPCAPWVRIPTLSATI